MLEFLAPGVQVAVHAPCSLLPFEIWMLSINLNHWYVAARAHSVLSLRNLHSSAVKLQPRTPGERRLAYVICSI